MLLDFNRNIVMTLDFYAGDLLGLAKTSVRNYAIAITETATPRLREVLTRQINSAIQLHAQVLILCMNVVTIQLMI